MTQLDEVRDCVELEIEGHVAVMTLNRPQKLNALTVQMAERITDICTELECNSAVRVLLIKATGGKSFSAGSDINMLHQLGSNWEGRNRADYKRDYIAPLLRFKKPIIAAIDGYCLGGGLEVAICADIRLATPSSTFGAAEIRNGWHSGSGNVTILPRLIGYGNGMRYILTGEKFDAKRAYEMGFLQEIVEREDLEKVAMEMAELLASLSPVAIQSAKKLIRQTEGTTWDQGLAWENDMYSYCMLTEDAKEGIAAFGEKRKPVFSGN
ncbi:enoyl-CoA hydratase/isomerase family protein [Rhodobacteraceae bacterium RKSG542]|uniref:enoyl-CoA hydratase/isomerase family protein n=1 Tax=Pseudovibrio flavus TaxID=2529854 RepID=UPI0012BD2A7C|nr:enoyl-CoA hydratase/isomerase family protein [Pseudovibrio flavus]MTI15899.1 enoyl-CoA hydratase/isomerase family protein [Pseudovibrio flavus]